MVSGAGRRRDGLHRRTRPYPSPPRRIQLSGCPHDPRRTSTDIDYDQQSISDDRWTDSWSIGREQQPWRRMQTCTGPAAAAASIRINVLSITVSTYPNNCP